MPNEDVIAIFKVKRPLPATGRTVSREELLYKEHSVELSHLSLTRCTELSDEVLKYLPKSLKSLDLTGCKKMTEQAIQQLQKELSGLTLVPPAAPQT